MTRVYSHSIHKRELPQYAYALAIFSGGLAFVAPQLGSRMPVWLPYAILAALFGSIWPHRATQWAVWLCLPVCLLFFFNSVSTGKFFGTVLSSGPSLVKSFSVACLGAYVGSKLSIRKIAGRSAGRRAAAKRLNANGRSVHAVGPLVPKVSVPALPNVKRLAPARNPERLLPAAAASLRDLSASLIKAAAEGDLERVRLLIAEGANVNTEGCDPLASLMTGGSEAGAGQVLFGEGVSTGTPGEKGWTALMAATIEGHLEVVRALVWHGAEVNAANGMGWTALRFAVSMGETEILRLLLNAGSDANRPDQAGRTALMQAAGENIVESLKALLIAGADPHARDMEGQTALLIAQKRGHTEVVKLLKVLETSVSAKKETPAHDLLASGPKAAERTHRVIRARRDQYYGLVDRYEVIPLELSLPRGCEETGIEGSEEECWNNAWKGNIGEPAELGWWLRFSDSP